MSTGNSWLNPYRDVARSLRFYWKIYGGASTLIRSPYLHVAAVMAAIIMVPIWDGTTETGWFEMCLTVIPNLLGFTLGGYAILLAFGDERFRRTISGPDPDGTPSPFMVVNAAFVHFIVIQAVSLLLALICKAWEWKTGLLAFIGSILFVYAIFTAVAAALAVLNLANWFDRSTPRE